MPQNAMVFFVIVRSIDQHFDGLLIKRFQNLNISMPTNIRNEERSTLVCHSQEKYHVEISSSERKYHCIITRLFFLSKLNSETF